MNYFLVLKELGVVQHDNVRRVDDKVERDLGMLRDDERVR